MQISPTATLGTRLELASSWYVNPAPGADFSDCHVRAQTRDKENLYYLLKTTIGLVIHQKPLFPPFSSPILYIEKTIALCALSL